MTSLSRRGDGRHPRLSRGLDRVDLLILDDWGLEPLDAGARHELLEILEDRYGRRSTLVTSQLPVDQWHAPETSRPHGVTKANLDFRIHSASSPRWIRYYEDPQIVEASSASIKSADCASRGEADTQLNSLLDSIFTTSEPKKSPVSVSGFATIKLIRRILAYSSVEVVCVFRRVSSPGKASSRVFL